MQLNFEISNVEALVVLLAGATSADAIEASVSRFVRSPWSMCIAAAGSSGNLGDPVISMAERKRSTSGDREKTRGPVASTGKPRGSEAIRCGRGTVHDEGKRSRGGRDEREVLASE
jgi:hypothetical protein